MRTLNDRENDLSLGLVPLDILVGEELRTCLAAHGQGADNVFWPRFLKNSQRLSHTPASARQARGTCLRSTSSWDSSYCSRRTGYIHTSRPAGEEPDHIHFHVTFHIRTLIGFYQNPNRCVPASVCPPQTAGTAPSLPLTRPSSSGRAR